MITGSIRKRVNNKGEASYQVVLEIPDKASRKREYYTFYKLSDAKVFLANQISDYDKNLFVERNDITVYEMCHRWVEKHKTKVRYNTYRNYRNIIENKVKGHIGDRILQTVTPADLADFYISLRNEGLAESSILDIHRLLHIAFKYAYVNRLIKVNITELIKPPKQVTAKTAVYDEKQVRKLIECSKDTIYETPVILAVSLGMRRGEICGLQWENIDFINNCVNITHAVKEEWEGVALSELKTESSTRTVVAPADVMEHLKAVKEEQENMAKSDSKYNAEGYVCCDCNGKFIDPQKLTSGIALLAEKAGLPRIRFHDLRHTNATLMLKSGVPVNVVSERLGHARVTTTLNLYVHPDKEMDHKAAQIMDEYMNDLLKQNNYKTGNSQCNDCSLN